MIHRQQVCTWGTDGLIKENISYSNRYQVNTWNIDGLTKKIPVIYLIDIKQVNTYSQVHNKRGGGGGGERLFFS